MLLIFSSCTLQVLQKLGKADETKDEQFEQVVINFRRQEVREDLNSVIYMRGAAIQLPHSDHQPEPWKHDIYRNNLQILCVCVCQSEGSRLQREMKSYMAAIKGDSEKQTVCLNIGSAQPLSCYYCSCLCCCRDAAGFHQPDTVSARSLRTRLAWKRWHCDHWKGLSHWNSIYSN